jgi:hypothetical protein
MSIMENKETSLRTEDNARAVDDVTYFKYIFKKTEKISCAVFYILRSESNMSVNDIVVSDVEDSARAALDVSLASLRCTEATLSAQVHELRFALLDLESKLRVASAARYIGQDLLGVFMHEIDSVYRGMKRYTEKAVRNPLSDAGEYGASAVERKLPRMRDAHERVAPVKTEGVKTTEGSMPGAASRRERVIEVLRDNPNATIKDITSVVTECSEKTIQRELISMIKDNIVVREGERRWSKYTLVHAA